MKVDDDAIQPHGSVQETIYSCYPGVAISGLAQELIKHLSKATECL